jgi:hypothetical protein
MTLRIPEATVTIMILVVLVQPTGAFANSGTHPSAGAVVAAFCAADFGALPARDSLVVYTKEAERRARRLAGSDGFPLVDWVWDPLQIVTQYRILDVKAGDSTGTARVRFFVVARSRGRYKVESVPPVAGVDTLQLVRRSGRWWILDPPPARVSIAAEVGIYSSSLASRDSAWFSGALQPQLDDYMNQVRALSVLRRLATSQAPPKSP